MANDDHPFRTSNVHIELEPDLPAPLAYPAQGYQQHLLREHAKRCEQVTPPEWARKLLDKDEWLQRQLTETQPWTPTLRSPIIAFSVLFLWSCYLAIANPWPRFNVLVPGTAFAVGALFIFWARRRNHRVIKLRAAYQAAGSTWVANPAKREEALAQNYTDSSVVHAKARKELEDTAERLEELCRHAIYREQSEVAKKRSAILGGLAVKRTYPLMDAILKDEQTLADLQTEEIALHARLKALSEFYTDLKCRINATVNALGAALAEDTSPAVTARAETFRIDAAEKFRTLQFYAGNPLKIPTRLPPAEEAEAPVQATMPAKAAGKR